MTDNLENKRKKLIFRAGHRGTKEMDLILGNFAADHVHGFTPEEVDLFEDLLNDSDPDLYNWIMRKEPVPAKSQNAVMDKLLAYKYTGS